MAWRGLACGGALVILSATAGCAPAGRLSLAQSHLQGYQKQVQLQSDQVNWAGAEGTDRVIAEFPLPGARTGRPTYLLYFRLPTAAKNARFHAGAAAAEGFLIQTRGEYAGLARITGGELRRIDSPFSGQTRRFHLDARCDDGTQLVGELTARRDDFRVGHFETRQRPADVQNLLKQAAPAK